MILRSLLDEIFGTQIGLAQSQYRSLENPATPLSTPDAWLFDALGAGRSDAGVPVSEQSSLGLSAVWTCVSLIAGAIASLPLKVYERQGESRMPTRGSKMYRLLHDAPNLEDTSYSFRHKLSANLLLWGNGYAEIQYDNAGRVYALWPWPSAKVRIELGPNRGDYWYRVDGYRIVRPEDMLHLRGFCYEGLVGLSPIQNLRRTLGIGIATEVFAAHFYKNGAKASGVLTTPGKLTQPAMDNLKDSFHKKFGGVENAHKTIVLEEGTKYTQLTIPQNDSQFIETRMMSRAEIAGIYGVPTMLVPGADKTPPTYASSESFMRYFADFCLRNWLSLWQQELNSKLFDDQHYAEFELRDLLRADASTRAQFHKSMWEIGAKNADEIRQDENENPLPRNAGQKYFVPLNYIPSDLAGKQLPSKAPDQGSTAQGDGSQPGARNIPAGYARILRDTITQIRAWTEFSEKRAVAKLEAILRPIADDICDSEVAAELAAICARKLAERAKLPSSVEDEVALAFKILGGESNGHH